MIIGSTSIKKFYPEFRKPSDLDVIDKDNTFISREEQRYWIPEFEELKSLSNDKEYLDPDLMLTLKASHANWNIHWDKTMMDILFLQKKGHVINKPLYYKLVKGWRKIHGKEAAPLKGKTADQFFGDAVTRKYVHDDIHEAVAYYDEPLYLRIQPNKDTVECSEKLFDKLKFGDKIRMCKEEIFVTALERFIIPSDYNYSQARAYNSSLKKFVTTMSSNWMSLFLIENFSYLKRNREDYVGKFKENEHNCNLIK